MKVLWNLKNYFNKCIIKQISWDLFIRHTSFKIDHFISPWLSILTSGHWIQEKKKKLNSGSIYGLPKVIQFWKQDSSSSSSTVASFSCRNVFSQNKLSRLVKCVWHAFPKKRLVCDLQQQYHHSLLSLKL